MNALEEYEKFAVFFFGLLAHCLLLLTVRFSIQIHVEVVVGDMNGIVNSDHIMQHIYVDYNMQLMNHPMGSATITSKPSLCKNHSN